MLSGTTPPRSGAAEPSPVPAPHRCGRDAWNAAWGTDVGLVRAGNEDSCRVSEELALVADGLGGHAGGEVASRIAIETIAHHLEGIDRSERTISDIIEAVQAAHRRIVATADEQPHLHGMGTTLTGLVRLADDVVVVNVGDSRTYQVRSGRLTQLTRDDSLVADLVDAGHISASFAPHHPQRSVITAALGLFNMAGQAPHPTIAALGEEATGRFVVCSDGLSDPVDLDALHPLVDAALARYDDPLLTCRALIRIALDAGGPDNVTVAVVDLI